MPHIVEDYILNSSDSRSFKIRPLVNIPKYDENNITHKELSILSYKAHEVWNESEKIKIINEKLDELVLKVNVES